LIVWINGAFGSGKTSVAYELNRRIKESVDKIGKLSEIKFEKNRLSKFEKVWFRVKLTFKHIRF
jgi:uridine kinase